MEAYNKIEQFLKNPFDVHQDVSWWVPPYETSWQPGKNIQGTGDVEKYDVIDQNPTRQCDKSVILRFPTTPPEIPVTDYRLTTCHVTKDREKELLKIRGPGVRDVMLAGLDGVLCCYGDEDEADTKEDQGIRSFMATLQRDCSGISKESQTVGFRHVGDQGGDDDLAFHDPRLAGTRHHQIVTHH